MSVALLPLGLIAIWQTQSVVREATALRRASLLAETKAAAEAEYRMFENGAATARVLARVTPDLGPESCGKVMENVVDTERAVTFVGFTSLDGIMTCNSTGAPIDLKTSTRPGAGVDLDAQEPKISIVEGAETGLTYVVLTHPVFAQDRELLGQVLVSIPHEAANAILKASGEAATIAGGLRLASFNSEGALISADGGPSAAVSYLPSTISRTEMIARQGETFAAQTVEGEDRLFAVAPLIDDQLYLVGSWPLVPPTGDNARDLGRIAMFFPALMWIVGMIVAIFGLQRLVLRHITDLRSAMRKFALGERVEVALKLDDPPQEFADAERAFNRMALLLTEAEARRETDLHDKEVLLREVHHRVKNNLQLIASIMNMQMRRVETEEARFLLAGLQQRIRGLATLHRTLYTEPDTTTIDSQRLVAAVIEDISNSIGDLSNPIRTDLVDLPLYPDQALPLSMIVSEALTNALKHSDPALLAETPITVRLERLGGNTARLTVANPVTPGTASALIEGEGLGRQLKTAFVRQLEGTMDRKTENGVYALQVTFEVKEFMGDGSA